MWQGGFLPQKERLVGCWVVARIESAERQSRMHKRTHAHARTHAHVTRISHELTNACMRGRDAVRCAELHHAPTSRRSAGAVAAVTEAAALRRVLRPCMSYARPPAHTPKLAPTTPPLRPSPAAADTGPGQALGAPPAWRDHQ